jgi:hypothetical protein
MLRQFTAVCVLVSVVGIPLLIPHCAHADDNEPADSLRSFHVDNAELSAVDAEERAGIEEWNANPTPRNIGPVCPRGDVNSQGLTDSDEGFVQDSCPPGIATYYYDAHTGRCLPDCLP